MVLLQCPSCLASAQLTDFGTVSPDCFRCPSCDDVIHVNSDTFQSVRVTFSGGAFKWLFATLQSLAK